MDETKEPVKKTTTRKSTTRKPKVEEPVVENNLEAQMKQMMEMMAMQQQMFATMMSQMQQPQVVGVKEEVEEIEEPKPKKQSRVNKGTVVDRGMTKQGLRRKYHNKDIFVQSAIIGSVSYNGKNEFYEWSEKGEVIPMTIDDIIAMPDCYLHNPWLVLDDYENDEEVLDDIISCLGLENMYRSLYILTDLDENINKVDMEEFAQLIRESRTKGGTLDLDATAIVQDKIDKGILDSKSRIDDFERILGRTFNK